MMHADDIRWIEERANEAAHRIGSRIRKQLLDHYGADNFPVISLQGVYEAALVVEMAAAFARGWSQAKMDRPPPEREDIAAEQNIAEQAFARDRPSES